VDRLLKQTKKFLFHKIIPRAGSNHATGRIWPAGRMFDTPALHNTQCQLVVPILVLLPRCKFGHFGTYYFYANCHYLVQLLITHLKQNKHNNKKKSRQTSSYLKPGMWC